jgi:pimeloyl-ACP methyl ester carboxylesterase
MKGWLRCDYQFGTELIPSLSDLDSHSSQSYDPMSRIEATGQSGFVVVGHSQGGMVSRYTAQRFAAQGRGHLIEGVVSLGTPHQGALLARNMKQSGLDGLYKLYGVSGKCGTRFLEVSCHLSDYVTRQFLQGWLNGVMNVAAPTTQDLQPGSSSN